MEIKQHYRVIDVDFSNMPWRAVFGRIIVEALRPVIMLVMIMSSKVGKRSIGLFSIDY